MKDYLELAAEQLSRLSDELIEQLSNDNMSKDTAFLMSIDAKLTILLRLFIRSLEDKK